MDVAVSGGVEMSGASSVDLVVLDLGGVLIRVCRDWEEACRCAGIEAPAALKDPAVMDRLDALSRLHETGQIDTVEFAYEAARALEVTAEEVMKISAAWLRGVYPGAVELLEEMSRAGVRKGCLSNTNEHHWRLITCGGNANALPMHLFEAQFASHLIGLAKPDPEVYRYVEKTTGVASYRILYFDDDPMHVAAAQSCGWQVCQVHGEEDPPGQVRRELMRYHILRSA